MCRIKNTLKAIALESQPSKSIVTLRLEDGELFQLDLLLLHQHKSLFYELPKDQIDHLSREATLRQMKLMQHEEKSASAVKKPRLKKSRHPKTKE